jgi:hypothetical protein
MQAVLLVVLLPMLVAASAPLPTTDLIVFRGTEHTITVRLETELGSPIENATIYFYHEEQNALLGSSSTNQTGHAVFAWQIPRTHKLGPTSLNATFLGDEERHLLPSYIPIPLTVLSQTVLSAQVSDGTGKRIEETVYPDQTLIFAVHVQDDQGQPLQGVSVCLLGAENQTIAMESTAQNGVIVFRYRLGSTLPANVLFSVRSSSLGYFGGTELELLYHLGRSPSTFVGLPSFIKTGTESVIAGRLRHEYRNSIPLARIRLLLDGVREIAETFADEEGRFRYSLDHDIHEITSGRFVTVAYDGDTSYMPTRASVGLILSRAPTPFSQLVEVVLPTQVAELLYCIGLVAATCTGVVSTYLTLKIKRATSNIVSH